ncbi:MAG: sulfotransferase, partial [Cytophagales bacterium]|nr:sulfotransferase [Cytophagales bacterium]
MKLDFIICGAQKSATTYLKEILSLQPQIQTSKQKELHFFDMEHNFPIIDNYESYHRNFDFCTTGKRGEATPIYMYWKPCIERIHQYNPSIKIIISLRDPVKRAYSQWKMFIRKNKEHLSFEEAIEKEGERLSNEKNSQHRVYSYMDRCLYAQQLTNIYKFFPQEQVFIVDFDELVGDSKKTVNLLCDFLGVEYADRAIENVKKHSGGYIDQ